MSENPRFLNIITVIILLVFIAVSVSYYGFGQKQRGRMVERQIAAVLNASDILSNIRLSIKKDPSLFYRTDYSLGLKENVHSSGSEFGFVTLQSRDIADVKDAGLVSVGDTMSTDHYPPLREITVTVHPEADQMHPGIEVSTVLTHP